MLMGNDVGRVARGLPAIRTTGLSKRSGTTMALDALDLTVAEGEVYG
jgi:ABC-type multidrug transport system ATPase subunit